MYVTERDSVTDAFTTRLIDSTYQGVYYLNRGENVSTHLRSFRGSRNQVEHIFAGILNPPDHLGAICPEHAAGKEAQKEGMNDLHCNGGKYVPV